MKYTNFSDVQGLPVHSLTNVRGIVNKVHEISTFTSGKSGQVYKKRLVVLKDTSSELLDIDLWNNDVHLINETDVNKYAIIDHGKVNVYQGHVSVSMSGAKLTLA